MKSNTTLLLIREKDELSLVFKGEFTLFYIAQFEKQLKNISLINIKRININLNSLIFIDTAAALFIEKLTKEYSTFATVSCLDKKDENITQTLELVRKSKQVSKREKQIKEKSFLEKIGEYTLSHIKGFFSFISFLGIVYSKFLMLFGSFKKIRYKEILFEINETAVKAIFIVFITSFLMGVVVSYQSAFQLKLYGANIFIVDMLGISILRELSPLITAIVIAGRSGSAFAAQIGAMKITEELDAMRTMGFDPYMFLVIPRIIALMIVMPILIFISDIAALFGGMIIANVDLGISVELFLDRFSEVIALKHFAVGIVKGPFFAFLIASIGIYRGMLVKNDTQSIGFNTTRSVVESIFAVIVCDAIFSIAFTNLGI